MGNATVWMGSALAAAALAAASPAYAAGDVGLINQLSGEVSYSSGAQNTRAQAFMKVREGDKFTVPAGAQVRVVYFQGGRQESYSGPATFTAGTQQSSVQSGAQPQVTVLPSGVPQRISQTPELIQIAKLGRSGGVTVRGAVREQRLTPQQQAEVRAAQDVYKEMRAERGGGRHHPRVVPVFGAAGPPALQRDEGGGGGNGQAPAG